jgi:TRAP-type C4-dicarboxylate transport system permease small subunit
VNEQTANSSGPVRYLHLLEDALLVFIVLAMILLSFGQIIMRNLFDVGFVWVDPMLRVMVLWIGMLGALIATRLDKHITIDVLTRLLSPGWQLISRIVTRLFTALVASIIAWHSARFVIDEREMGSIAFSGIPAWILELIIPLGFGLITIRYVFEVICWIRDALREKTQ